jgi:DNA repair protein RecO (recombination protein O)
VASRSDEAIVLARYPFRERDLVVTLLARRGGQIRALARSVRGARTSRSASLEPLALIRVTYFERAHSELATLDDAAVVRPSFALAESPPAWAAGQVIAELSLTFCPAGERAEEPFRLVDRSIAALLAGAAPLAVVGYAELWLLKLSGVLPELDRCAACGGPLAPGARLFDPGERGFVCALHPPGRSFERLSVAAAAWLRAGLRSAVEAMAEPPDDVSSWLIGLVQGFAGKEILSWRYLRLLTKRGS